MTTAHRPTFDPARGKEAPKGPAYHQRLLPAHTQLKYRKPGQGGNTDHEVRDLRAELLAAEASHFAKVRGTPMVIDSAASETSRTADAAPTSDLQRELEKIKRERAEKREREEQEKAAAEAEAEEREIARGNPLLNKPDFTLKRRWDDDVVFKNQARGTDDRGKKKEFINDLLRSDFHKRFMSKYVR
ncbi:pre-mRNA-splicing factor cwc15 [Grosmannia clavigera kw1407]|uniref:Pre-mRNA-splicing factor cwc15 n=1 Tax=Grosmannia clavigera (strain kw1407 / UAMH 11150) TaxID=655863 RepID=F0XC48_GROCL|nr:pre-mRNA-splicing factor cwc15 [Grosmannia clavigera kw1407]EFX03484.1 pre-mRNA-splicing factor cwc15 [Grosmannia clavigera kw1407]